MKLAGALALLLVAAGCGGPGRSPVGTVRDVEEAAREGDGDRVLALLGPKTRARLAADARLAEEQAGRRQISPSELVAVGWTKARFRLDEVREVERRGDHAVVEVRGRDGERQRLELVRDDGRWKVELP